MTNKLPQPIAGQVIRYSFLWQSEAEKGLEEGSKDRPCAVILVVRQEENRPIVRVLPITHSSPQDSDGALELPLPTKQRLGLDDERSWVILDEANDFQWPGPDLKPRIAGDMSTAVYGLLPPGFMKVLAEKLMRRKLQVLSKIVQRTE